MTVFRSALIGLLLICAPALPLNAAPSWTPVQTENLARWVEQARHEAIDLPADRELSLRAAIDAGDSAQLDAVSQEVALELMRAWRGQCCGEQRPAWWRINGLIDRGEMQSGLSRALRADRLDLFLRSIRSSHPHYLRLANAYKRQTDPARRAVIAKNLARWRWLPANLGGRYLFVNIANQKLTLWEGGEVAAEWRVIVGKPISRTPVFTTYVTGVVLNPWWEIPSSIAAEGIAGFVQRSPTAARASGYIYQSGRYRQMPGENNALGRVKLVMPNPYGVLLHDTSKRELFSESKRAFSHGCVRVDRAPEFAAVLFNTEEWNLVNVEEQIATNRTRTVALNAPIPLYVAYFTAEPNAAGDIEFAEDIYNRDEVNLRAGNRAPTKEVYGSPASSRSSTLMAATGAVSCPI